MNLDTGASANDIGLNRFFNFPEHALLLQSTSRVPVAQLDSATPS